MVAEVPSCPSPSLLAGVLVCSGDYPEPHNSYPCSLPRPCPPPGCPLVLCPVLHLILPCALDPVLLPVALSALVRSALLVPHSALHLKRYERFCALPACSLSPAASLWTYSLISVRCSVYLSLTTFPPAAPVPYVLDQSISVILEERV